MTIEKILCSMVGGIFQGASIYKVLKIQMVNDKEKCNYKMLIMLIVYTMISLLFIPNQFRFISFIFIIVLILKFFCKLDNKKSLLYPFNVMIIFSIAEIIITIILVAVGFNSSQIVTVPIYNLMANVIISCFVYFICLFKFIRNLINKINYVFYKNEKATKYFYIFMIILYSITLKNGLELVLKTNYYVNIFVMVGIVIILNVVIKNEYKTKQLNEQYKQMLSYVTKYEKIITEQGKANHEFKNQLMVIRGYAQMNNMTKLISYLDEIIADSSKTKNSYLIKELNKFPDGGIKGLLYYKLSSMDDEKIKYEIEVENGIKTKLKNLDVSKYKNITKVLGVLLDNAIDSSKKCKNKNIILKASKEDKKVTFTILNTYKGKISIDKIEKGYSSKGKGHGYGLKLVKDIIENNNEYELESKIEKNYYIAIFSITTNTKK